MPFTLAHPIAALPLWWGSRRRLDLPALMVGAAIPDISYFIALQPVANIGHQLSGIFLEGIPSALALLFIGKYVLWQPVIQLLPSAIARKFPQHCPYRFLPLSRLLTITLSIALGAATHIIWDSFTHPNSWGTNNISGLSYNLLSIPIYKWLQYSGGLIGFLLLLCIAYWSLRAIESRYQTPTLPIQKKVIALIAISAITILTIFAALQPTISITEKIIAIVVGSISGSFIGFCFYALCFWLGLLVWPKISD